MGFGPSLDSKRHVLFTLPALTIVHRGQGCGRQGLPRIVVPPLLDSLELQLSWQKRGLGERRSDIIPRPATSEMKDASLHLEIWSTGPRGALYTSPLLSKSHAPPATAAPSRPRPSAEGRCTESYVARQGFSHTARPYCTQSRNIDMVRSARATERAPATAAPHLQDPTHSCRRTTNCSALRAPSRRFGEARGRNRTPN